MSDYEKALAHAKAGELEKAQTLLLGSDHPKADILLEKVNKAIAARGASGAVTSKAVAEGLKKRDVEVNQEKAKQGKDIRNRVVAIISVIVFVLAVLAGLIAFTLNQASPTLNVLGVCTGVIVSGRDCDVPTILTQYPNAEANCKARLGNWTEANKYDWQACMMDEGVVFEPAN